MSCGIYASHHLYALFHDLQALCRIVPDHSHLRENPRRPSFLIPGMDNILMTRRPSGSHKEGHARSKPYANRYGLPSRGYLWRHFAGISHFLFTSSGSRSRTVLNTNGNTACLMLSDKTASQSVTSGNSDGLWNSSLASEERITLSSGFGLFGIRFSFCIYSFSRQRPAVPAARSVADIQRITPPWRSPSHTPPPLPHPSTRLRSPRPRCSPY